MGAGHRLAELRLWTGGFLFPPFLKGGQRDFLLF